MTLVELLVAVAIGLIVTLAVTSMMSISEAQKRSTTGTNDMGQSGSFAMYQLDRALRSAGSGLVQSGIEKYGLLGCTLNVASFLPRASAFPVPFKDNFMNGTTSQLKVAPLLIAKSKSDDDVSDVLVVMGGNGGTGAVPRRVTGIGSATELKLDNSVGFAAQDVLLVSREGQAQCVMQQVESAAEKVLTIGGKFKTSGDTASDLASNLNSYVTPIGNTGAGSIQMQLFGVGANNTLYSYDLLQATGGDNAQAMAEGVQEMHALYGVDENGDGVLDFWADPGAAGWDYDTVKSSVATMRKIVAVRLALVTKSSAHERDPVVPSCDGSINTDQVGCDRFRYFAGLKDQAGTSLEREVNTATSEPDRHYRMRVVESTIPLRNLQLLP